MQMFPSLPLFLLSLGRLYVAVVDATISSRSDNLTTGRSAGGA